MFVSVAQQVGRVLVQCDLRFRVTEDEKFGNTGGFVGELSLLSGVAGREIARGPYQLNLAAVCTRRILLPSVGVTPGASIGQITWIDYGYRYPVCSWPFGASRRARHCLRLLLDSEPAAPRPKA